MKRIILAAVAAAVLVAAVPAVADARPYLSNGEAARYTGRAIHIEYDNIRSGSLDASCQKFRWRSDMARCSFSYYDHAGTIWGGRSTIREMPYWAHYEFRYRLYDEW